MAFEYAVALTGSIATGKSSVARMFEADGFCIIDADTVAHEVLESQQDAIGRMFGDEVIQDGKVDRKVLGSVIFAADYVIDNTKDQAHLRREYEQARDAILKEFA